MSGRKITVKSGNEEFTMNVTEEEYQKYYRPWWRMKKKEQRNREAMEQNGYTEESYEGWKDGLTDGQEDEGPQVEGADAVIEKRELLEILGEALDALLPEERELVVRVVGEEMPVAEFAVTRHFIVDEKSILFSTVSTPLRHLHFADRTLLSRKLCSQIKIFRLELCVQ